MMKKNNKTNGIKGMAAPADLVARARQNIIEQLFDKKFEEKLRATAFPIDRLVDKEKWISAAYVSLHHASQLSLGVNAEGFRNLLHCMGCLPDAEGLRRPLSGDNTISLNMFDFSIISNNLEKRTPFELSMDMNQYLSLIKTSNELVQIWNEIAEPLKVEVMNEIDTELKMQPAPVVTGSFKDKSHSN